MPELVFDGVSKWFGTQKIIQDFTATVPDKEFLVLLGPSGCGKSTMLRVIAGLTEISAGSLRFDGEVVNDYTPKRRNIAFVFQSYALYPHMSVRSNIAFPLIMDNFRWWHHIPIVGGIARRLILRRREIVAKIQEVAAMLELTDYLDRKPKALSGGQRQRVALARSLIREPSMYLLDEPLSNLDAKLRSQMRSEISSLHSRVQKTFVYVTHDQVEAMTMGTRIIVLNEGAIQQYGSPKEIYDRPANTFVARFIGSPPMNLLSAQVTESGLRLDAAVLENSTGVARQLLTANHSRVQLGIRAEKMTLTTAGPDVEGTIPARVVVVEHLGSESIVGFRLHSEHIETEVDGSPIKNLHYAKLAGDSSFLPGDECQVSFPLQDAVWFDGEDGVRIDL